MTFSVLFIFIFIFFIFFEECRMGSEAVSNETRTLLKIQMPVYRNPPHLSLKSGAHTSKIYLIM